MRALRAHVQNGQIVLDDPAELPEGALLEVLFDEPTAGERADLDAELDESAAEVTRGEVVEARGVALRLLAKP